MQFFQGLESRRLLSTVAYWRFDEGPANAAASSATGAILDSSDHHFNGTAVNGPKYRTSVLASKVPQTGATDKFSLDFNGTNQRVTVPDNAAFALTKSLTLEAFINIRDIKPSVVRYIVFRGDDRAGLDPYWLAVSRASSTATPMLSFHVINSTGPDARLSAPITLNKWHYVAGTLDNASGKMTLYIDGVAVASKTTTVRPFGTLVSTKKPGIGIGNVESGNYSQYFNGLIDEVRISDTALAVNQLLGHKPNQSPHIASLSDSPDPVNAGAKVTLTASSVADSDGTVSSVSFYRESNGHAGLQTGTGGDALVGTDTSSSGGWSEQASTSGLSAGKTYTYYARARDNQGALSNIASTTNTVHAAPATAPSFASPGLFGDASIADGAKLLDELA